MHINQIAVMYILYTNLCHKLLGILMILYQIEIKYNVNNKHILYLLYVLNNIISRIKVDIHR